MKEDYITVKFSLDIPLNFKLGDSVDDTFGLFELMELYKPAYNKETGGYDYELRLDAYYWKWKNKIFKFTPEKGGQEAAWNLTAPLDTQMDVFLRNLNVLGYTYKGKVFEYTIDNTVNNSAKLMSYDSTNMIDALSKMAEAWECEWWVTDSIIHFGRLEHSDPVDFEIGVNVEEMTCSDGLANYATRIYAFGSTRNLPANYRPVNESVVVNGVVQRRLMLPASTPYIDAYPNMRMEEAVEQVVIFDDIYPRRVGTMVGITTHEYTDKVEEEGKEPVYRKWNAYRFKDTEVMFSKDYILPNEELKITFQSGKLNGMTFAVIFNPCDKEGGETPKTEKLKDGSLNPAAQVWEIIRNEDYGRELPGDVLIPRNGDKYVLSGWDASKISEMGLVAAAELELKEKAEVHRDKVKIDPSTYTNRMMCDEGFILFDAGARVNLVNPAIFETGSRQSRIIGFEYNLDLPYDHPVYTVGETASYSRIAELENKIESVMLKGQTYTGGGGSGVYLITFNDSTPATDRNTYSAKRILKELKNFLHKDKADRATEIIAFLKGLLVGENGSGITVLDNGMSQAVVDYLYVKVKAVFDALEIKKKTYVGGEQVLSPAGMKCIRVEELADAYRCHFKMEEDGIEIENRFTPGCLAIAQECNIKTGISRHAGNRYYWREVMAVGADYIDLSKTVCDPNVENDVPAAGDDIVAFGHRTDISRQAVIVLSSVNEVAPSILMYQGIDDFSLVDKEVIAFDYDKATGKAAMRVYGDAYIGARDRSSYIEYTENGLEVKAKKILLGTGGTLDDTLAGINNSLENVSHQLDESFQVWQGETADTPTLANLPASSWATDDVRSQHVEDFYITTEGLCYQFVFEDDSFRWRLVTDKYLIAYVQQIGEKKRVFISRPTDAAAYDAGDCWVNASYTDADGNKLYDNDRLVCVTAKASGTPFSILHWRKDSKYTDDSKAEDLNKETVEKLLSTGIDIENNSIIATADKFMIQGRDGKKYAVFELDVETGQPIARMTGRLIAKAVMASGLDIDGKFVVNVDKNGNANVSIKGDFNTGDGVTYLGNDGTGWIGKILNEYFAKWDADGNGSLCYGSLVWNSIKKLLTVNGQVNAKGGSKIGNLTIDENGSLSGGNAIFEDLDVFSPFLGTFASESSLASHYKSYIIDRIAKSTTIIIGGPKISSDIYTVDLPSGDDLSSKNIRGGFRLTLIAVAAPKPMIGMNITVFSAGFRITSRPRKKWDILGPNGTTTGEFPNGEIRNNNNGRIEHLNMKQGDVVELYYYGGVYYQLNYRT